MGIGIVPQILSQNTRKYFSNYSKKFFPGQKNFLIERWKKLGFVTNLGFILKSKFE